jgi:hypothetical protein
MKNYFYRYMLVYQVFYLIERCYVRSSWSCTWPTRPIRSGVSSVNVTFHLAHKALHSIISKGTISWSTIRLHMLVQIINLFTKDSSFHYMV